MSELAMLGVMTPVEMKQAEHGRIAPVMAAIAALPGAALVYGSAAGAPLFAAALVFIAASYASWILLDAFYYQQLVARRSRHPGLLRLMPERWAVRFYWAMIGYAIASIAASLAGFAGMHGAVLTPVPAWVGFAGVVVLTVAVAVHIVWGMQVRNAAFLRLRRIVERSERRGGGEG